MPNTTTIVVDKKTRDEMKLFGTKDETYDEIIKNLMNLAKKEAFHERQKKILKEAKFVDIDEL